MKAWYFAPADNKLRYGDNREIVVGKTHTISGTPKLCKHGLHGSERLIDALYYAPGSILYKVEITGKLDKGTDKVCGQRRKYLAKIDATSILQEFARKQALIHIEKIKPYCSSTEYEVIMLYLTTGEEKHRAAARVAATAAWDAAADANTNTNTWNAARAARAAWAAWSAVDAAAADATRDGIRDGIRAAAWDAAAAAADAIRNARNAAWDAALDAANLMLTSMVEEAIKGEVK